jgi:hypothetical protein
MKLTITISETHKNMIQIELYFHCQVTRINSTNHWKYLTRDCYNNTNDKSFTIFNQLCYLSRQRFFDSKFILPTNKDW